MREIPLTKGYAALIDNEDYERVSRYKWCVSVTNRRTMRVYALRRKPGSGNPGQILLHREIMDAPDGIDVDHINGNTLDCRKENMRLATRSQNLANNRRKIGISGFRGVTPANQKHGWTVLIRAKYYGTFDTPEEAARRYDEIATGIWGEFARLNFPKGVNGAIRSSNEQGIEQCP